MCIRDRLGRGSGGHGSLEEGLEHEEEKSEKFQI